MPETKDLPHVGPPEPPADEGPKEAVALDDQAFTARPYGPLIGFLEVTEADITNKDEKMLDDIWEYLGKETKSELKTERLKALQHLENRLSPPKVGQSRLHKIHSYIQAQRVVAQSEAWRDSFLRSSDE